MKGEQKISDTIEINVDLARKAVGTLFNQENEESEEIPLGVGENSSEDMGDDLVDGYDSEPVGPVVSAALMDKPQDSWSKDDWPEDEWPNEGEPARRRVILPPKPAVKVNASMPATSRSPLRPKRPSASHSLEDDENQQEVKAPPKNRKTASRYLFIEEDDEFTSFRQRYRPRDRSSREAEAEIYEQEERVRMKRSERSQELEKPRRLEKPERSERLEKPKRPRRIEQRYNEYNEVVPPFKDEAVGSAVPAPVRIAIIGVIITLLMVTAFLVWHNSVIARDLAEANELLLGVPAILQELSDTRIELETARENLTTAQAQIAQLAALAATEEPPATPPNETPETPEAPEVPGGDRIHIVVPGDNLSRISRQFFGNDSPANIQRIVVANNIADPDNIPVGEQLVIPY